MSFSWRRVGAVLLKELRDYRRNRFILTTMTLVPVIFIIAPLIQLFAANAAANDVHLSARIGLSMIYLLVIPVTVPAVLAS